MDNLHGRTIFVTGAGGFIGPALVQTLLERGASVRALVGPSLQAARVLDASRLQNAAGDITEQALLTELARGSEVAVHLAGPASVARSFEQPAEYARVHVQGTLAALEACRKARVARFVYVSSAEVYGRPEATHAAEHHAVAPRSPYAAAKASAELFVRMVAQTHGLDAIILRPFSVYGPGAAADALIPSIVSQARAGREVVLHDLRPVRDYCHVGDLADVLARCCNAALEGVHTINIGTGRGLSVAEVARHILEALGRRLEVREDPVRRRPADSELHALVADTTRARELLNFSAATRFEDGIEALLGTAG
jgi:nucleoside-diphosphate-sugar epimerase